MPPKKSRRQTEKPKKGSKGKPKAVTIADATPSPISPRRDNFENLNRTLLRRECEKRSVRPTNTNEGTKKILRKFDIEERGAVPVPQANQDVAQSQRSARAESLSPAKYDFASMNRTLLRLECKKRGIRFAKSNEETRRILQNYEAAKPKGRPASSAPPLARPQSPEQRFASMTMKELKIECSRRGITANPAKKVTVQRLRKFDDEKARTVPKSGTSRARTSQPPRDQQQEHGSVPSSQKSRPPIPSRAETLSPTAEHTQPSKAYLKPRSEPTQEARVSSRQLQERYQHFSEINIGPIGPSNEFAPIRMRQQNVGGAGNCLFHAFALTFYGNVELWNGVRQLVRDFYRRATRTTNTGESRTRGEFYGDLNVADMDDATRQYWSTNRNRRQSRYNESGNLYHQLHASAAWGDHAMLQVIADAFDVEIFAFSFVYDGYQLQAVRGRFGARQIFLANYPNLYGGHWNPLFPLPGTPAVTDHIRLDLAMDSRIRAPIIFNPESEFYLLNAPPVDRSRPAPSREIAPDIVVPLHLAGHTEQPGRITPQDHMDMQWESGSTDLEEEDSSEEGSEAEEANDKGGPKDDDDDNDDNDDNQQQRKRKGKDHNHHSSGDSTNNRPSGGASTTVGAAANSHQQGHSTSRSLKRSAPNDASEIFPRARRSRTGTPAQHTRASSTEWDTPTPSTVSKRSGSDRQASQCRKMLSNQSQTLRRTPEYLFEERVESQESAASPKQVGRQQEEPIDTLAQPEGRVDWLERMVDLLRRPQPARGQPQHRTAMPSLTSVTYNEQRPDDIPRLRQRFSPNTSMLGAETAEEFQRAVESISARQAVSRQRHTPPRRQRRRQPNQASDYFDIYEDSGPAQPEVSPSRQVRFTPQPIAHNNRPVNNGDRPRSSASEPEQAVSDLWWRRDVGDAPLGRGVRNARSDGTSLSPTGATMANFPMLTGRAGLNSDSDIGAALVDVAEYISQAGAGAGARS